MMSEYSEVNVCTLRFFFFSLARKGGKKKKKPGKEWRWEQVVKQCEKHEGEKRPAPAHETQPGSSIAFQQSSADWVAQTGGIQSTSLNYAADSVTVWERRLNCPYIRPYRLIAFRAVCLWDYLKPAAPQTVFKPALFMYMLTSCFIPFLLLPFWAHSIHQLGTAWACRGRWPVWKHCSTAY